MRRTPYTDRLARADNRLNRQSFEVLGVQTQKQDFNLLNTNLGPYIPAKNSSRAYNIQSKFTRQSFQRPITVTRAYSELKNRSQEKQLNLTKFEKKNQSLRKPRYDKEQLSKSKTQREMFVASSKQKEINNFLYSQPKVKDQSFSKGKICRGSLWKNQEKGKFPVKNVERDDSKYSNNSKFMQNLTSTTKQQRNSLKKAMRNGDISDLLSKNIKQRRSSTKQDKKQEQFFQYVMRFSYRTKKGYIPSNPEKVNQDSYIISPNIGKKTWQHFFAVCDGHGPLGHHVSSYIKNTLPNILAQSKNLQKKPSESLMKSFQITYQKMLKQSQIDMTFSGSTIISCYLNHNKIYCSNVGDSRAILGRKENSNKKWKAIPLSEDHKPSLPKEADRIKKMNGRVQSYKDEFGEPLGPLRVWLKNQNVPGLAMTRSFGDLVGASVGVSPVPQIKQFTISKEDRILLIASDGVFQFLQNQEIIDSLSQFYQKKQIQQASDHLLSMAHKSWSRNSSIVDDITFILIFLTYQEM